MEPAARFDKALARYVGEHDGAVTPGAVVVATVAGQTVYRRAVGLAQTHDCGRRLPRALHVGTRFDLASITKVAVTTTLALRLAGLGRLDLDGRVGDLVPAFAGGGKDAVTLRHLLRHDGGLAPWLPVYVHASDAAGAIAWVAAQPLAGPPGAHRAYSDLGFMLLGAALEGAAGARLDTLARDLVFAPLGMDATGYGPGPAGDVAATSCGNPEEQRMLASGQPYPVPEGPAAFPGWRQRTLVGEANDANAYHAFAGVAGHAGLFGTAERLARAGFGVAR